MAQRTDTTLRHYSENADLGLRTYLLGTNVDLGITTIILPTYYSRPESPVPARWSGGWDGVDWKGEAHDSKPIRSCDFLTNWHDGTHQLEH
jgi:hypothetical protein